MEDKENVKIIEQLRSYIARLRDEKRELGKYLSQKHYANEALREALHPFVVAFEFQGDANDADYIDAVYTGKFPVEAHNLRAAIKALRDTK